jgi:uncharacterized protein (DUF1919 family)
MCKLVLFIKRKLNTLVKLTINRIKSPFKKRFYRSRLHNDDFTIIASNCIGAKIYQELGIEYNTPFVGLFIYAPCYIKLLKNLDFYLRSEIKFIKKSKYLNILNQNSSKHSYPIGLLAEDIEIHFMHYRNENEAKTKWERRKKRINMQNLFFTFTDRDCCNQSLIEEFDQMPFPDKVCFTAQNYKNIKSTIWLPEYQGQNYVNDLYSEFEVLTRHFDFVAWLNRDENKTCFYNNDKSNEVK